MLQDKPGIDTQVSEVGPLIKTKDLHPKYKSYTSANFRKIPQVQANFSEDELFDMEVVATVLPFKTNNYVVDELINWNDPRKDPTFILTFPQRNMLQDKHFAKIADLLKKEAPKDKVQQAAIEIRNELNPHPAGQVDYNIPTLNGKKVEGMQHKYMQTALFFPRQGQTCHAYCTFCFRWPQFVNTNELKFAAKEVGDVIDYIKIHPEITDILITGGDPMVMSGRIIETYFDALIEADIPHLQNIRIGSKSLAYWPYKYVDDSDSEIVLGAFEKAIKAGKHVAFMAHFNHYVELSTPVVQKAIKRIRSTGVQIRTQSPIFNNINADPDVWTIMWKEQVKQGLIPYYMFVARDTGAQHYFKIPLVKAWEIFRRAYENVSGLSRTVRGPSMSCGPGKIQILGVTEIQGEKVFVLRFLQGRNPDWVHRPFFAKYDEEASWIDDLKPAFGEKEFFFEQELRDIYTNLKMTDDFETD